MAEAAATVTNTGAQGATTGLSSPKTYSEAKAGDCHEDSQAEAHPTSSIFMIMKKIFFIALLAALFTCFSCSKADKHEQVSVTPTENYDGGVVYPIGDPNTPITLRSCDNLVTQCFVTVTSNVDANLDLCGDLTIGNTCTGCNTGDLGISGAFLANTGRTFCVNITNGKLCVTNNNASAVTVTVQFSGGPALNAIIPAAQTHCWHTNADCKTIDGC